MSVTGTASKPGRLRRAAPWLGLAVSAAAALWVADEPNGDAEVDIALPATAARPRPSSAGASRPADRASPVPAGWPAPPASRHLAWGEGIAAPAWGPPPVPPPARMAQTAVAKPPAESNEPPPPAPPPAFPYQVVGRLEADGTARVMLSGPVRTLAVGVGDQIDGQWRVDAVQPTGLGLTWLPTGQRLSVAFRAS